MNGFWGFCHRPANRKNKTASDATIPRNRRTPQDDTSDYQNRKDRSKRSQNLNQSTTTRPKRPERRSIDDRETIFFPVSDSSFQKTQVLPDGNIHPSLVIENFSTSARRERRFATPRRGPRLSAARLAAPEAAPEHDGAGS